jgi:MEMO1 family protein
MYTRSSSLIRQPAVAGTFYPAAPAELATLVKRLLSSPTTSDQRQPAILVVPHAGYTYSGAVAGAGFSQVADGSRVILLGVSHHAEFDGVAVDSAHGWQTPLGETSIDRDLARKLIETSGLFCLNSSVHRFEHALEVHLPFLQMTLPRFQILPLLLGSHSSDIAHQLSYMLADVIDNQTLLVISSDLSHYPTQAAAEQVDQRTIQAILAGDPEHFRQVLAAQMRMGIPGLTTCACGASAIEVAIRAANLLRLRQSRLISYTNSGAISSDPQRVVGYASITFDRAI